MEEQKKHTEEWKTSSKMVNLHPTTWIITSEVNVLHTPIKRHSGLKNKTQLCVVYRRDSSNIKAQIGEK